MRLLKNKTKRLINLKVLNKVLLTLIFVLLVIGQITAQNSVTIDNVHLEDSAYQPLLNNAPKTWETDSLSAIKNDKRYNYVQQLDSIVRARQAEKASDNSIALPSSRALDWLRILLFVIGGAALLWLIQNLAFGKKSLFKKNKHYSHQNDGGNDEAPAPTLLETELENALKQENFRLAIRYLYLMVLNHLETNGYLVQVANKTNFQYALEIQDPALRNEFSKLLMYYEYTWFGHINPTATQFENIHAQFKNLLKR